MLLMKILQKIESLCDEVERLFINGEDHTQADIEFHNAIASSSKNLVVPRIVPIINSSIPLFVQVTKQNFEKRNYRNS